MKKTLFVSLAALLIGSAALAARPDPSLTPGALCSPDDPDFSGYRYAANIAICSRNISDQEKQEVAREYGGIPQSEWSNYEFDHLIPLNAGGSNDIRNIWPQPIDEAKQKDVLEYQIYNGLRNGTLTQDQAVQEIQDWVNQH